MFEVLSLNHGRYLAKENIIEVITLGSSTTYLIWVTMWDSSGYEEMVAGSEIYFLEFKDLFPFTAIPSHRPVLRLD